MSVFTNPATEAAEHAAAYIRAVLELLDSAPSRAVRVWAICSTISAPRHQQGLCRPVRFCSRCSRASVLSGQGVSAWVASTSVMSGVTVRLPAQA